MLLGGLWHGANWVFVLWGAYHGALLAFERSMGKRTLYAMLPRPVRVGCTFVLILFSWVLFRSPTLEGALQFFGALFGATPVGAASPLLAAEIYTPKHALTMGLCALLAFGSLQAFEWVEQLSWRKVLLLIVLFCFSLAAMSAQAFSPFLYFQF